VYLKASTIGLLGLLFLRFSVLRKAAKTLVGVLDDVVALSLDKHPRNFWSFFKFLYCY